MKKSILAASTAITVLLITGCGGGGGGGDTGHKYIENENTNIERGAKVYEGQCVPGNTVTLYENNVVVPPADVLCGANGMYSIMPSPALSAGNHSLVARQTNPSSGETTDGTPTGTDMSHEVVRVDKSTGLMWVASMKKGNEMSCKPINFEKEKDAKEAAVRHCHALVFSGHDDWRAPTILEAQGFINTMKDQGVPLYYSSKHCYAVIGVDGDTVQAVTTDLYGHSTGEVVPWDLMDGKPDFEFERGATYKSPKFLGLKCVRGGN